jgi:hypothetical protein
MTIEGQLEIVNQQQQAEAINGASTTPDWDITSQIIPQEALKCTISDRCLSNTSCSTNPQILAEIKAHTRKVVKTFINKVVFLLSCSTSRSYAAPPRTPRLPLTGAGRRTSTTYSRRPDRLE